ncbi:MAG: hypothetical protein PHI73_04090 [Patescibacteria group bacterium]|nr:hypothetical protein [Patescibacteria group bacterium]
MGLSRMILANQARVNPGQLSSWLRRGSPLSLEKQGLIAQIILTNAQTKPNLQAIPEVGRILAILETFVPRIVVQTRDPSAAWKGEPIFYQTPFYMPRYLDEDAGSTVQGRVVRIAITGGPKTGKTSLLLKLWGTARSSCSPVYIDLRWFRESSRSICSWLQEQCEIQIRGGALGSRIFIDPPDLDEWLTTNILLYARKNRCLILLDHPELLSQDALATLNEIFWYLAHSVNRFYCGLVFGCDPSHPNPKCVSGTFPDELRHIPTVNLHERQVYDLIQTHGVDADPHQVFERHQGHVFLTQTHLAELHGAPLGTEESALKMVLKEEEQPAAMQGCGA